MTESEFKGLSAGSDEIVAKLVQENMGWATAIAKSVARAWNMDWQLDGLDGGAYEALLFCARRYDPARGVPFRAYARRRIHESATQEARKSKTWQQGVGSDSEADREAREISARLFDIFPELRDGILPLSETEGEDSLRGSVRQLLAGASLLAAFQESGSDNPEIAVGYRQVVALMATLDPVHQAIVWAVYYQGQSMRSLAEEWGTDDLSIIREHKEILEHLSEQIAAGRNRSNKPLKVRRGLRAMAMQLRKNKDGGPFTQFLNSAGMILLLLLAAELLATNARNHFRLASLDSALTEEFSW